MGTLTRGTTDGGMKTPAPPSTARPIDGYAYTDIPAITPCYQHTDGTIRMCSGAADNAAAVVDGWTVEAVKAGEKLTLYVDVKATYGKGAVITPGTFYYLHVSVAGALQDTPPFTDAKPVCRGVKDNNITGPAENKLLLRRTY